MSHVVSQTRFGYNITKYGAIFANLCYRMPTNQFKNKAMGTWVSISVEYAMAWHRSVSTMLRLFTAMVRFCCFLIGHVFDYCLWRSLSVWHQQHWSLKRPRQPNIVGISIQSRNSNDTALSKILNNFQHYFLCELHFTFLRRGWKCYFKFSTKTNNSTATVNIKYSSQCCSTNH